MAAYDLKQQLVQNRDFLSERLTLIEATEGACGENVFFNALPANPDVAKREVVQILARSTLEDLAARIAVALAE